MLFFLLYALKIEKIIYIFIYKNHIYMMTNYYVIYVIFEGYFGIVGDTDPFKHNNIKFYNTYLDAQNVADELHERHPEFHYHVRPFTMEEQFINEFEGDQSWK